MLWTREMLGKLGVADVRSIAGNAQVASMGIKTEVIDRIIKQAPTIGQVSITFSAIAAPDCEVCNCGYEATDSIQGPGNSMPLCEDHAAMLIEALDKLGISYRQT